METSGTGRNASRRQLLKGIAMTALSAAGASASAAVRGAVRPAGTAPFRVGMYDPHTDARFASATPWASYRAGSARGAAAMLADCGLSFETVRAAGNGGGLAGFDVIVAPHVPCMSDREAAALDAFVAGGGLLIASGMTAGFHADGRPRSSMPLLSFPIAAYGEPQDARGWMLDSAAGILRHAATPTLMDGFHFRGVPREGARSLLPVMPDIRWGPPEFTHVAPEDQVRSVAGLMVRRHGSGHAVHIPFLNEWHYGRDRRAENRAMFAAIIGRYAVRRAA